MKKQQADLSASVEVIDGEIVVSWPRHDYHKPLSARREAIAAMLVREHAQGQSARFTIKKGRFQFHYRKSISEYVDRDDVEHVWDDVEHVWVHSEFYIDPDFAPCLGATRLVL